MIVRLSNWEDRLNLFLTSRASVVFEWGEGEPYEAAVRETHPKSDCAMFAAGAVEAQTGVDLGAELRGKYVTEQEALALVKKHGGLAGYIETLLPRVPRHSAQRGDIVLTRDGNLGVVFGGAALVVGEDAYGLGEGLLRVPRPAWRKAWRVG